MIRSQFIMLFQGDSTGRTGRLAVATEDTAQHIYIKDLRVPLTRRYTLLFCVLVGLDINSISRAGPGAKETADTTLQPTFITMQDMSSPETRGQFSLFFRIRDSRRLLA